MSAPMKISGDGAAVDESLYSRQLYVFGHEAQRRMATSSVLIVGLDGLGVETAKNIILSGVKSVTLHDDTPADWVDMASQFYIVESELGFSRAQISAPKLAELNPYVPVSVISGELTTTVVSSYDVVVLIGQPLAKTTLIADYCHGKGIAVLVAETKGVFGSIFCDFGENFVVHDKDGEQFVTCMIAGISRDSRALVTVLEETRHNLETGDKVILTEISGMEELNGREFTVVVKDLFSFEIDADTSAYKNAYERGGYVNQVKQPITLSFNTFTKSIESPGEFLCDFNKLDRAPVLHLAFRALNLFKEQNGVLPEPGNQSHAQQLFDISSSLNESAAGSADKFHVDPEELKRHEKLIKRLALCARGQVSPVCALIGGVLGQEVLKAVSGKFTPITQWFYYDATECLSEEPLSAEEVSPLGSRYDGQIMVFGKTLQSQLASTSTFLVGAGAIGCEMIKNFAMMGVACGPISGDGGKIGTVHVTDMDQIEKSNLSRQFLFRNTDIGQPKSSTAVRAVATMNPSLHAIAYENKVAPDTEALFNDDFFEGLDIVCAALDNVEARLYLDQRCLFYHKPMLESGTLGTKGHTQVVVPGKTEHYGATRDPPEKSIPLCTLKSFPNQIEHTLQWAREWFEEVYTRTPEDVNQYLTMTSSEFAATLAAQQNVKLDTLTRVKEAVVDLLPKNFDDCVVWARLRFEDLFSSKIKQLMYCYPIDKLNSTGIPFWSGAKKPPAAVEFDGCDPLHLEFIKSAAGLRAYEYGLPVPDTTTPDSEDAIRSVLSKISVPEFRPRDGVTIATTEEEAKNESKSSGGGGGGASNGSSGANAGLVDIDAQCDRMLSDLPSRESFAGFRMKAVSFEKDDDSHMRVVAAVGNLRARNYKIPEADMHKSRGIAGKITPAIATTTALVTGASCLELFKLLQDKPASSYFNTFNNLAVCLFTSMEPQPPTTTTTVVKGKEWKWTQWDCIDIKEPAMTLKGLIAYVEEEFGAELSMLSQGVSILFSSFMNKKKLEERMNMTLKQVVESVTKKDIPPLQKYLIFEIIMTDPDTDDELEVPYLRFKLY